MVKSFLSGGLLLAAAVCAVPAWAQSAPQASQSIRVPSEAVLAQFPKMTGFRLSPDGKHMLAIESNGDTRTILVWKTDDLSAKPAVIGSRAMRIEAAGFLKNDMLSVRLSQPFDSRLDTVTKTFISKLMVTDLAGKEWKEPLAADGARSDIGRRVAALQVPSVRSRLLSDPDHVIVESDGLGLERDLFRYNVRTGSATRVMRLAENDIDVVVNAKGEAYLRRTFGADGTGAYFANEIRNSETGRWEEHFRSYVKERDVVEVVGKMVGKAHSYVLRSNVGREFTALYEYDAKERKVIATLFEHKFFDATGVRSAGGSDAQSDEPGQIDGFAFNGLHGNEVEWVSPAARSIIQGVAKSLGIPEVPVSLVEVGSGSRAEVKMFAGASVSIADFHAPEGGVATYLLRVSGLNYPTEHYLLRGQRLSLLAREFPELDRRALGNSRWTYYKSRDGLNIPAILTVPNAQLCGPGPYAAVVHPHGGPWQRDNMDYDWSGWVPLMVSRCHAVLQPQYRGSANLGRTLWKAGDAEWGQKMQDDKDDGAQWLVSEKIADPKRLAIFGFSYGGYAAMAASVRAGGPFKCAISGAGVSDIGRIWDAFYTNPIFRDRQEPTVRGLSPLKLADKLHMPILVYHGDRDQTVPLVQSEIFVDRAKGARQPVEYHVLKDYAHGPFLTVDTNTRHLKLISDYFKTGCGGSGL